MKVRLWLTLIRLFSITIVATLAANAQSRESRQTANPETVANQIIASPVDTCVLDCDVAVVDLLIGIARKYKVAVLIDENVKGDVSIDEDIMSKLANVEDVLQYVARNAGLEITQGEDGTYLVKNQTAATIPTK